MFWKIYFWSYVALSLVGAYGYSTQYLTLLNILGIFLTLLIGMGVYSLAFSKHFLSKQVWILVFYFILVILTLETIYYLTGIDALSDFLLSKYIIGIADWSVTSIILLPALIALWILGNGIPQKKSKKK
jgi:hypothetical protein